MDRKTQNIHSFSEYSYICLQVSYMCACLCMCYVYVLYVCVAMNINVVDGGSLQGM